MIRKAGKASGYKLSGRWPEQAAVGVKGSGNPKEPAIQLLKGSSKLPKNKGK